MTREPARVVVTGFGREGYTASEVDDFLDRIQRELASGQPTLTESDVLNQRFTPVRFGQAYDMDQVDHYLDSIVGPALKAAAQQSPSAGQDVPSAGPQGPSGGQNVPSADGGAGGPAPTRPSHPTPSPEPPSRTGGAHPAEQRPGFLQRLFGSR
ncbi:DivIVA domain-containing protein [Brachybacterium aquaticum]|uniref:DivIVA domain-containing protein n=1 Tax=Brachybacterium aquaticum TaxID=1432564 RepID=A0A841AFG5_9MICO|nr:DivIVA domain-containing protein [Brachybacterium aquaticum]MBB5832065.1 DivIVA domain-containing protein [Brachybacterium aquaticum]